MILYVNSISFLLNCIQKFFVIFLMLPRFFLIVPKKNEGYSLKIIFLLYLIVTSQLPILKGKVKIIYRKWLLPAQQLRLVHVNFKGRFWGPESLSIHVNIGKMKDFGHKKQHTIPEKPTDMHPQRKSMSHWSYVRTTQQHWTVIRWSREHQVCYSEEGGRVIWHITGTRPVSHLVHYNFVFCILQNNNSSQYYYLFQ